MASAKRLRRRGEDRLSSIVRFEASVGATGAREIKPCPLQATCTRVGNLREVALKSTITQSTIRRSAVAAGLLSSVALGPLMLVTPAAAAVQPNGVNCAALVQIVKNGAGNKLNPNNNSPVVNPSTTTAFPGFNSANPVLARIINGTNSAAAYCQVVFQLNSGRTKTMP